jgi:SAM-dependent methyltransferase
VIALWLRFDAMGTAAAEEDPAAPISELEDVACLACGLTDGAMWGSEAGFSAMRCGGCGLVYVTPRPTTEARSEAARMGSHQQADGTLDVTGTYSLARMMSLRARLIRLHGFRELRTVPRRWLDLGCGHGELLAAVGPLLAPGSEIVGVEPNEAKRIGACERGLTVYASLDEVEGSFDTISLMNVYSHLPDPVATFAALSASLVPNGELLLETGNGADLNSSADYLGPLDLPDHLSFASESQLRGMLDSAGMEITDVQRARLDGLLGTAWESVKGRWSGARWRMPFRSDFVTLYVRARLREPRCGDST